MSKSRFLHAPRLSHFPFPFLLLATLVGVILIVRVVDLMIINGVSFRSQADENRFFRKVIQPHRGVLIDRNGLPLVKNTVSYKTSSSGKTFVAHPLDLVLIDEVKALELSLKEPESVLASFSRESLFVPQLSHVLGYVGFIDPSGEPFVTSLEERVGKAGLERALNKQLRGGFGERLYEMSADGKLLRLVSQTLAQRGEDVQTTLDSRLSTVAYTAFAGRNGAAIISNPNTGEILAMVSSPGYSMASFSAALNNEQKPLINRAITAYPPGSTFKMMTALAALEDEKITSTTMVHDEGEIKVGEQVFGNWYYRQYGKTEGNIALTRALSRSNDIYFYKTAELLGPTKLAEYSKRFGLGKPTGIELVEEHVGLLPSPAWKEKEVGEKWYLGDTYHMGIGQGYILSTPLQINRMTAGIATKGKLCSSHLVQTTRVNCEELGLNADQVEIVIKGMIEACSTGGTAFPFFEDNERLADQKKVACKTGTAEFGGSDEKGRKKTHGWFTMFYPSDVPMVAITVFIESSKENPFMEGSKDGAPIARTIWQEWKRLGYEK